MNTTLIILGVIIAILIYVLWYYYYPSNSAVLSQKANLNAANPDITSLNNPTNTRYGYGIWIYVNSWNNQNDKIIFSRAKNITLRLDKSSPTLYCDIVMSDGTTVNKTMITDNFPLQKWVYVIVSIDNQFLDCYLDGKLVKSTRLYQKKGNTTLIPLVPPSETTPIKLGSSIPFDAVVASFTRWSSPVDPQTAWSTYIGGNTPTGLGKMGNLGSYGANLSILQNNSEYSKITLF